MKFIKDLLFFEINTTGQDSDKDSILQLSAVLLDKDNLLEKSVFNSYVRVSYMDNVMAQHAKLLSVRVEEIKKAQKIYEVVKLFQKKFSTPLLLASNSSGNILFLKNAFKKSAVPFDFDPHILDLWTLGYVYTLNAGMKKMPAFSTFVDYFRLRQENPFNALEKVRLGAEIFRRIVKEV